MGDRMVALSRTLAAYNTIVSEFQFQDRYQNKSVLTVYKKTGEWYIEPKRVTVRGTSSDNERQRVTASRHFGLFPFLTNKRGT